MAYLKGQEQSMTAAYKSPSVFVGCGFRKAANACEQVLTAQHGLSAEPHTCDSSKPVVRLHCAPIPAITIRQPGQKVLLSWCVLSV